MLLGRRTEHSGLILTTVQNSLQILRYEGKVILIVAFNSFCVTSVFWGMWG
jgi:hypothetical protein